MKKTTLVGTAFAGLALLGCGSIEPGRTGGDLAYVDATSLEARTDLFIDPAVSWRPMTLEQLGSDEASAIPVEVDIYGGVAVAWLRDGSEGVRGRADIVSLYRVYDHVAAPEGITPVIDETHREGGGVVYTPGPTYAGSLGDSYDTTGTGHDLTENGDYALVDWIDVSHIPPQEDLELWRELGEQHPGCLGE